MSRQYTNTRQTTKQSTSGAMDEGITTDARILAAIELIIWEEMGLENTNQTFSKHKRKSGM